MCNLGSGLGDLLGTIGGGALDIFAPEIGLPLSLATGLGGALGGTVGGLASGEGLGKSLVGGLEGGALGGLAGGVGNVIGGGDFLGAPAFGAGAASAAPVASDAAAAGGAASAALPGATAAGTQLASAAPLTVSDTAALTPAATAGAGGGIASSAGAGGPATLGQIASAAGSAPADVSAGVSSATPLFGTDWATPSAIQGGWDSVAAAGGSPLAPSSSLASTALNFAKNNPGLLLGGGGILASLLMNNSIPGINALKQQEALEQGLGTENLQLAERGQIPGSQQAVLDAAEQAAEAQTRSTFGREGIGGSTMEAQAIAADKIAEAAQKNQIIQQIMNSGIAELGQSGTLANNIMTTEIAQNQDVQNAIAKFAAALAGSSGLKAAA